MKISLFKLYMIFVKIGAILLGGGYVILPIITNELCKKRKLIEEDDVINYFAISQSLPGIVAANMSIFAGYKLRGKSGALCAAGGIITVPFIIILTLASVLHIFSGNSIIGNALWGIGFAVIALIFCTAKEVWEKAEKDYFFYLMFLTSLFLIFAAKFTPVQTVLTMVISGIILKKIFKGEKEEKL